MPPVPFLWVVPLSLYLISFIIAFDHERWYRRLPYGLAALIAIYLTAGIYNSGVWGAGWLGHVHGWICGAPTTPWQPAISNKFDILCQFAGLFLLCMLCHGELVRLRPQPRYLTSFYLMIAAGGALGGLSVSIIAPQVFHTYAEWKIGLGTGFVLAAVVAFILSGSTESGPVGSIGRRRRWLSLPGVLRAGGLVTASLALLEITTLLRDDELSRFRILEQTRNFYGVLSVIKTYSSNPPHPFHALFNGGIRHGIQFSDAVAHRIPTTYYSTNSGIGLTLAYYLNETAGEKRPLRVGVVGLGIGTLAAYLEGPEQSIRFYEINPEVTRLAETYFTYLADARERNTTVEIVLGDARLSLERELEEPQAFDVLVLDAFSGDSIPTHLLTREAFEIYLAHLARGGALAVHTSNRHVDLVPVVYGLAEQFEFGAARLLIDDTQTAGWLAEWVILSRNEALLERFARWAVIRSPMLPRRRCRCGPTNGIICWKYCDER